MSAGAKAKEALDAFLLQYKRAKSRVKKAIDAPNVNERSIGNKMVLLSEALTELNIHHSTWVSKAGFTDEQLAAEKYSSAWLENEWDEVDDFQDQVDELTSQNRPRTELTTAESIAILRSQLDTLKSDISTRLAQLLQKTSDTDTTITAACITSYKQLVDMVKTDLDGPFRTLGQELLLLDKTNSTILCKEFEGFRRDGLADISTLQLRLVEAEGSAVNATTSRQTSKSLEMEKSKAPTFSGKTLDYPEFKRSWTAVAGVYWDDANQVEQIKHKVDQKTRRIISRCDTMTNVWAALDMEYAQEEEVIIAVNEELKNLTSSVCTVPEYMVELRNYLPVLEEALKAVNGLDHLCSPDRVNLLLTKFDERTLHEWDYFRTKNSGTTYERFFKFLLDRYDAAKSSIARAKQTMIASSSAPPTPNISINATKVVDETECRRCKSWTARDAVYTCPGCGRGTSIGERVLHCLEHCGAYMRMNVNERSACVEKAKWCPVHLTGTHSLSNCNMTSDSKFICGIDNCKKHHHKTLHGGTTTFLASVNSTAISQQHTQYSLSRTDPDSVLFAIQSVPSTDGEMITLFDDAANCNLIRSDAAKALNLVGEPMQMNITTAVGTRSVLSQAYKVPLIDNTNVQHIITAYEVENISENILEVDVAGVKHLFSSSVQDQWDSVQGRPTGPLDLLVGANVLGLHPYDHESCENMRIKKSIFGAGLILTGSHPAISSQKIIWSEDVNHIRLSSFPAADVSVNRISIKIQPFYDYFELDNMGVEPPRRCGNCRNCKQCAFRSQMLSLQEQYEYQVMESKVRYDPLTQSFAVSYPFTEDPSILPNNVNQVIKIHLRLEKKLKRTGRLHAFNQEFDKMLQNESLVELSSEEMEIWDGPVHYISLQDVVNEESDTTPLRVVSNSSLSDRKGLSLNSILMKGPNTLSDQWDILNKWRSYEKALVSDLTKAYHTLKTGETEKHIRRVVWRYGDEESDWRFFAFCTVSFGDKPAAVFLEIAIKKIAELNEEIDPIASTRIRDDRYVDDFATGGTPEEVSRFVGNEQDDFQCDGTFSTILSQGSFRLKAMVASGETNQEKIKKIGGKVLGVGWNPSTDTVCISLSVSLKTPSNEKIVLSPTTDLDESLLTPRNLLGVVNGIHDPLGLVAPLTARLRVAFRDLFQRGSKLEWDVPVSGDCCHSWVKLIKMLVSGDHVTFRRCIKCPDYMGKCQIICFFDGSDVAYGAAIYARWVLSDGSVHVCLLCAKTRVTPLLRISTPRSELNGAVLAVRLLLSCLRSLSHTGIIPEKVWFIGDSECILACLEKVNAAFGEYFGNRIGEIIDTFAKIELLVGSSVQVAHVCSQDNAADQATRLDSTIDDVGMHSVWQTGKPFLKDPPSEWPTNRDFASRKEHLVPQVELLKRFRCLIQTTAVSKPTGIDQLIDPLSTNYWSKLVRRTQNILLAVHKMQPGDMVSSSMVEEAKRLWFLSAMGETVEAQNAGKLRELDLKDVNGLKVICGRASVGMQNFLGSNYLPVIMASTRVAYLIMLDAHCKDHAGRDVTMATSRHEAWIVKAKGLAKKIVRSCIRCRFLRKQLEGQKMAPLPAILQNPSPPFTNVGIDLVGPITVKPMVNKRSSMKIWVAIFVCLNTKAVSMELAPGYSTDDFLLAYSSHVSIRGIPLYVHTDRGSQLVAAHKELSEEHLKYDWDQIAASTSHQGTTWQFAPAGGQWRNGVAEAFVKKFKLSFYHLYKDTRLNFAELNCAIKRIANVLNDRPVSAQRTNSDIPDQDFLRPLTPNMLLTGRNATGPPSEYTHVDDPHLRRSFIEELEATWWYQYKVQCFDSLIPTRKWVDVRRNMAVGDVVLIQYSSKSAPGTYRLGRVTSIEFDQDNLVRTCVVMYCLVKPVTENNRKSTDDVLRKEVRVPVQRLVLILPVEEQ